MFNYALMFLTMYLYLFSPGNMTLKVTSLPMLREVLVNITQMIPAAIEEHAESVYDAWTRLNHDENNATQPR